MHPLAYVLLGFSIGAAFQWAHFKYNRLVRSGEEWKRACDNANAPHPDELHVMQLAAISTVAYQNTPNSAKDRIKSDNPYWTVAYNDVCIAVDREIALRRLLPDESRERLEAIIDSDATHQTP